MADFWPALCIRQNIKISKDSPAFCRLLSLIFIGGSIWMAVIVGVLAIDQDWSIEITLGDIVLSSFKMQFIIDFFVSRDRRNDSS